MNSHPTKFVLTAFMVIFSCVTALAAIQPGSGSGWLIVGSRSQPSKAIDVASRLMQRFDSVHVFATSNGWYAITLGWMPISEGERYKKSLISEGSIPGDSYFHNGQRFNALFWSSTGIRSDRISDVLSMTRITLGARNPSRDSMVQAGYVTGLKSGGDGFLAVRTRPTSRGREISRLTMNTQIEILDKRNGWYNIRLQDGRIGWAYGKFIALSAFKNPVEPKPVVPKPEPVVVVDGSENGASYIVSGLSRGTNAFLSMRTGPSTKNQEIARLNPETRVTVTGKSNGWFRVKPNSTIEGWVYGKYLSPFEIPVIGPEEPIASVEPDPEEAVAKLPKETEPVDEENKVVNLPDEKRVALVMGNSAYKHTVELANPKNDADRISARLESLGFEVIVALDGSKSEMENSIREFVKILPGSDVALFFYAGHAMQVKGQNYLVPVDAKVEDATAIDFEMISLATILSFIDEPGRISIALLDACRDNPLSRTLARSLGATRSAFLGRGLASPKVGTGNFLIGFATSPGEVALDGEGDNSPFTEALLTHMDTPNVEIELMLKRVKSDVFDATDGKQVPWHESALRKEFYFAK